MISKLQQLASITGNSTLPILECLHYDGKGTFTASDLRNTMSISNLDIGINEPFCINAKDFVSILKGLSGGNKLTITHSDNTLLFKSGRSKYKLPTQEAKDFPVLKVDDLGDVQSVPLSELKDAIGSTIFAAGRDDLRIAMTGIRFDNGSVVTTDAHRMAMFDSSINMDFILPVPSARAILTAFNGEEIDISENKTFIVFSSNDTVLTATKIEERYPDWNAVVPKGTPYSLKVGVSHLSEVIGRLLLVTNDSTSTIVFTLGNECIVAAHDSDYETSGTEELEGSYDGEPLVIGFNGRLILDALKTVQDEAIEIGFTSPNRAALAQVEGKRFLFMPIMVVS